MLPISPSVKIHWKGLTPKPIFKAGFCLLAVLPLMGWAESDPLLRGSCVHPGTYKSAVDGTNYPTDAVVATGVPVTMAGTYVVADATPAATFTVVSGMKLVGDAYNPVSATQPSIKTLWRASVVALAAVNVMDARSSWGKKELNPNLSGNIGSFGREGSLIKLGIVGGIFVLESVFLRHYPSAKFYRRLALINFADASVTGAVAIRNFGVPQR